MAVLGEVFETPAIEGLDTDGGGGDGGDGDGGICRCVGGHGD